MKTLLRLEELALFVGALLLFLRLPLAWWWFPLLLLTPDLSMLGYLAGPRTGAWVYNIVHHKGTAILVAFVGVWLRSIWLQGIGLILLAHSSMDRIAGYGLKYESGFGDTHLGPIGNG